jgi:hypothetical protein
MTWSGAGRAWGEMDREAIIRRLEAAIEDQQAVNARLAHAIAIQQDAEAELERAIAALNNEGEHD